MKKYLFLIAVVSTFIFPVQAQECSREILAQKPGIWKASTLKGSTTGVSPADLAREKTTLANIQKMLAVGYNPKGIQALYSNSFGGDKSFAADFFSYNLFILRYLCDQQSTDKSKFYTDAATPTTVNIAANVIYSLNTLFAAEIPADDFRGYFKLSQKPQKSNGFYFLGEETTGLKGDEIKQFSWLITYGDELPFAYVSRKDYLILTKKRLEKTITENGNSSGYYDQFMNRINDYLRKSEAELSVPAICKWNDEESFNGFAEAGTRGTFIAVKPNMAYFKKNLPKSVPQFFIVNFKVAEGDSVFVENVAAVKKAIDFNVLRNMLGK